MITKPETWQEEEWMEKIQTRFGNGEKINETISGYLGDLLFVIREIVDKESSNAYWENRD